MKTLTLRGEKLIDPLHFESFFVFLASASTSWSRALMEHANDYLKFTSRHLEVLRRGKLHKYHE